MAATFRDTLVDRERLFSLGIEVESGRPYLSIPVSNSLVDYEEYYALEAEEYEQFLGDPAAAEDFLGRCRNRELDERLIQQPGRDRGVPILPPVPVPTEEL